MARLQFRQLDATARPAICSLPPALLAVVIRGGEVRSSHALLGHREGDTDHGSLPAVPVSPSGVHERKQDGEGTDQSITTLVRHRKC